MALATLAALVAAGPARAAKAIPGINAPAPGEVPHVEGLLNNRKFSVRAPTSLAEAAQFMRADDKPMVDRWGLSGVFDRLGFSQLVIFQDRSAFRIKVALPNGVKEVRTGVWPLGNSTIENTEEGSNEGWSGKCPPPEPDNAHVIIEHYAAPAPDAPAPFHGMAPAGAATKTFESHLTFPQVDTGSLEIKQVDRTGRVGRVEGRVMGQVSRIRVLKADMGPDEACKSGNYAVETESFDMSFTLELTKGF